jgi:hypothetical protein
MTIQAKFVELHLHGPGATGGEIDRYVNAAVIHFDAQWGDVAAPD